MLSARVATVLQIRPGEARPVTLLVALMFFPAAGNVIGAAAVEALLFARVGVRLLPYLYIAVGVLTSLATFGVAGLLGRVSRVRLYLALPPFLALILALGRLLVGYDLRWSYPALWLSMGLIATLQIMVAWGLAGLVFDMRQAKRLFPLFGAGGILGGALGGVFTGPLVQLLGIENLLLVWALTLMVALVLTGTLTRDVDLVRIEPRRRHSSLSNELLAGVRFARRSQLWRWIAWAAVLFALLFFMLTFHFSKATAAQFRNEDTLVSFLGVFQGLTTGTALVISLFLAHRVYARFGFLGGLLAMPLLYLGGFVVLTVYASFPVLVGFRFVQVVWGSGVVGSAYQGLLNVVPSESRDQTRAFIEGVPYQAGVVASGVLLLVGEQTLEPRQLFIVGVIAAALAVFTIWKAQQAYGRALLAALRAGQPSVFLGEEQPFGKLPQDAIATATAVAGISDPDPSIRRVAAEILGSLEAPEATRALVDGLDDPDPLVRAALLRSLARANAVSALLEVAACLDDPQPEVRVQSVVALHALAGYARGLVNQIEPLLHDSAPEVRAAVASVLLRTGAHPQALETLEAMVRSDDVEIRIKALEALADWGGAAAFDHAASVLYDPQPAVRRAALLALAGIDAQRCLAPLIGALGDEDRLVREAAAAALAAVGAPALEAVLEALWDPVLEEGALLALEKLPSHRDTDAVRAYARDRVVRALYYDDLWRNVRRFCRADERVSLLTDSLQATARRQGVNALRATSLLGDRDAVTLAIENLTNPETNQRANALETLDSIRERDLVRPALRLWEWAEGAQADPRAGQPRSAALAGWLQQVIEDKDAWLRACASLTAGVVLESVWRGGTDGSGSFDLRQADGLPINILQIHAELTRLAQSDPDPVVREVAAVSLNGGIDVETLPTLSLMERILFLRHVPLFADLPPVELKQVARITGELFFTDGAIIAQQGDLGDEMYIIVSGDVCVKTRAEGGEETELARRTSGDYVGEMAIISGEPRMASLVAVGDARLLYIDQQRFEGILRERPETTLAVMRVLCARLREREAGPKGG